MILYYDAASAWVCAGDADSCSVRRELSDGLFNRSSNIIPALSSPLPRNIYMSKTTVSVCGLQEMIVFCLSSMTVPSCSK